MLLHMFDHLTQFAKQQPSGAAATHAEPEAAAAGPTPISKQQEQRLVAPPKAPTPVDFGADLRSTRPQQAAMAELTERADEVRHGLRARYEAPKNAIEAGTRANDITALLAKLDAWNADAEKLIAMGDFMHDPVKVSLGAVARAAKLLQWELLQAQKLVADMSVLIGDYVPAVATTAIAFAGLVERLSPPPAAG